MRRRKRTRARHHATVKRHACHQPALAHARTAVHLPPAADDGHQQAEAEVPHQPGTKPNVAAVVERHVLKREPRAPPPTKKKRRGRPCTARGGCRAP